MVAAGVAKVSAVVLDELGRAETPVPEGGRGT